MSLYRAQPQVNTFSSSCLCRRVQRLNVPDTLRILVDAAITAEEAHARHTGDALGEPLVLVAVCLIHQRLRLDVAVEVIRDQVVIAVVFDGPSQRAEGARISEHAIFDCLKHPRQIWVECVLAVVVRMSQVLDVLGEVAEEENIILPDLAGDFNLVKSVDVFHVGNRNSHLPRRTFQ